jgi:AMMECR1 domain-containing protein
MEAKRLINSGPPNANPCEASNSVIFRKNSKHDTSDCNFSIFATLKKDHDPSNQLKQCIGH